VRTPSSVAAMRARPPARISAAAGSDTAIWINGVSMEFLPPGAWRLTRAPERAAAPSGIEVIFVKSSSMSRRCRPSPSREPTMRVAASLPSAVEEAALRSRATSAAPDALAALFFRVEKRLALPEGERDASFSMAPRARAPSGYAAMEEKRELTVFLFSTLALIHSRAPSSVLAPSFESAIIATARAARDVPSGRDIIFLKQEAMSRAASPWGIWRRNPVSTASPFAGSARFLNTLARERPPSGEREQWASRAVVSRRAPGSAPACLTTCDRAAAPRGLEEIPARNRATWFPPS